jgi:hypothetical protein
MLPVHDGRPKPISEVRVPKRGWHINLKKIAEDRAWGLVAMATAALAWTVATSVAVSVVQLVAQRGAAAGWQKVRGHYPEELD